jgi:quinoprotein glucose dehydrogenase
MNLTRCTSLIHALHTPASRRTVLRRLGLGGLAAALATRLSPVSIMAQATPVADAVATGEWPFHAHDAGGMRHSPLTQIDRDNVGQLQVAWTFHTGELETYQGTSFPVSAVAFEAVPIMVEGVLYFCTATARTFALDAATGQQRWAYDPKIDRNVNYSNPVSRGVSTWVDATKTPSEPGYRTLFVGTIDGRLIALDAADGRPRADFGSDGQIDLLAAAAPYGGTPYGPEYLAGQLNVTSPPAIFGDLVVVGAAIGDNIAVVQQRGVVQAFDARTGERRWSWDPIPREPADSGYDTWEGPLAHRTGGANAWPPISVDSARDLLFVPTTAPSPDYYGGERLGQNLFANCLMALRASTGEPVWHFQLSHHDLWDYDAPMQPVLLELEREGELVPAVAIGTKQGHVFVLHRETGEPLFPVEERPVPQSTVPGERSWPTQPFPAQLPVFGLRSVSVDDAWGLAPEDEAVAREKLAALHYDGVFTPVGFEPVAEAPSNTGGFNWGGLSYDPARGVLVGATNRFSAIVQLLPRDTAPDTRAATPARGGGVRLEEEIGEMLETPYVLSRTYLIDENRIPYTKPPWGTLAAVNLTRGDLQFDVPLGTMLDPAQHPEAKAWGSLNLAGPMTTAAGLVFVAASVDDHLRAFDTETGELLWEDRLPAGGQATPMTYAVDGKQYVVQAAGGHGPLGTKLGDAVVAYALP